MDALASYQTAERLADLLEAVKALDNAARAAERQSRKASGIRAQIRYSTRARRLRRVSAALQPRGIR